MQGDGRDYSECAPAHLLRTQDFTARNAVHQVWKTRGWEGAPNETVGCSDADSGVRVVALGQ